MERGAYAEDKARDALAFEPLPPSRVIRTDARGAGIYIAVRYSETLSRLLRSLPGAEWQANQQRWRYPYTSSEAIRSAAPEIERLAAAAQESADVETSRRAEARTRRVAERMEQQRARDHEHAARKPRPFRTEYLAAAPGLPAFAVVLEAIGDDQSPLCPPRAWVRQLFGSTGRRGFVGAFVRGVHDYTKSNSVGSRGVALHYVLEHGPIYEISAPQTWRKTERYFARVVDGQLRRLTRDEVEACLSN